jgi:hypothetical protein
MLLSFPFRALLQALVVATILFVVAIGWMAPTDGVIGAQITALRWAPFVPIVFLFVLYWAWRKVELLQEITFPYLGGDWNGVLRYETHDGKNGERPARLVIRHDFFGLHMRLLTAESASRTLAVATTRDPTFGDFRLYYVFEVTRISGVGADKVYRGTAVVQVDLKNATLSGDYFTEHKSTGHISFERVPG